MRTPLLLVAIAASLACRSVPAHPDPLTFTGAAACPAAFQTEKDEIAWRKNVVTTGRIGGMLLAASGPAVMIGGIALDDQPATPPVEAFVLGAGLSAGGVLAVVLSGVLVDDLEVHATAARHAWANPCAPDQRQASSSSQGSRS